MGEHADGIGVAVHHHVGETNIVVCGEVSRHDSGKHGLLVQLDVIESLERQAEISQQAVDSEETNDGEVAEHFVEVLGTKLAGHGHGVLVSFHGSQLLGNLGSLDERVQDVEDTVAAPGVGVLTKNLSLLLVGLLSRNSHSVGRESVELVNELIDNIPSPVVLHQTVSPSIHQILYIFPGTTNRRRLEINRTFRVQDKVEHAAISIVTLELGLEGGLEIERLSGLNKSSLDIVGLLGHGQRICLAQFLAILILDLLLVLGHQGLLLNIAVVADGAGGSRTVLISCHRGCDRSWCCRWRASRSSLVRGIEILRTPRGLAHVNACRSSIFVSLGLVVLILR